MKYEELDEEDLSLLLFLETCLVDGNGKVDTQYMSEDDFKRAEVMQDAGIIKFGRIKSKSIIDRKTHFTEFSDEAWAFAHKARRQRSDRMLSKITYKKNYK